jgi:hypothetical protein
MRTIVIEPHPDDAFLSIGWHLEKLWKSHDKTIVTVYADARRTKEAEDYAQAIGARSIVLGLEESKLDGETIDLRSVDALGDALGGLNVTSKTRILFPLGLQHPDHYRVALSATPDCLWYVDTPYLTKLKLADELLEKSVGKVIDSIAFPPKMKWKKKEIFKSQAKFFHFNPMDDFAPPELVLRGG